VNPAVPEIGFENGKPVRLFWPEQFRPREQLSAGTVRAAEIRMIALRFLCGLEPQSMADVARQRGVSRNAISAVLASYLALFLFRRLPPIREKFRSARLRCFPMKRNPKTFVELGRAGDILNVLPLVKREFERHGIRPRVMIAAPYAELFQGITYAEPLVWPGMFEDIKAAIWTAKQLPGEVIIPQIYGHEWNVPRLCTSFLRESWRCARADVPWGSLPLEFDRRNRRQENRIVRELAGSTAKPIVLLAAQGYSSPFGGADYCLKALLTLNLGRGFKVINLTNYRAPRMFDLLGLFERAHCLVTIDTGIKHLARACRVPVISLNGRVPTKWHASSWHPNDVGRFFYDEFPTCSRDIVEAIRHAEDAGFGPKIIHTWADFRSELPDDNTARRMKLARASWEIEYATGRWKSRRFFQSVADRDSRMVGDSRPVPFVHDLIDHAIRAARRPSDIIALTNADVGFTPGLTGWVLEAIPRHGAAFTHRWDFDRLDRPCVSEAEVMTRGKWYSGSDAFFFSVKWWKEHGAEFPDMILGREHWDEVFRQLIKRYQGSEICGAIYHEKHDSF